MFGSLSRVYVCFFFFNDTATTEIYTLSLHDALPIYFACVDWIDRQLGRVLAKLEEQGLMNNTYIVFTSDHGIAIGRHGLQGKQNLYEHTWKVPFIVRGPGIAAGSETDAMIYLHDVFPTFCDLAGATVTTPSTIGPNDGLSIRPVLEGTATTVRDAVYGVYRGGSRPGMRSIKNGRWKMIKYDLDGEDRKSVV